MKRENFTCAFLMVNYDTDRVSSQPCVKKIQHNKKLGYKEYNLANKNNKKRGNK